MKRVLIITYYWPPSGGSGVQRWLKFVKYLPGFGWEPVVFTVDPSEYPVLDHSFEKDIDPKRFVHRTKFWEPYQTYRKFTGKKPGEKLQAGFAAESGSKSWKDRFAMWVRGNFFIPDARLFWVNQGVRDVMDYLKSNKVDLIITTSPPQSAHLIGRKIKRKTGIPWIADFRDPWVDIYFFESLKISALSKSIHRSMEASVVKEADEVIVVGKHLADSLKKKYSVAPVVITNGFDKDDFPEGKGSVSESKFTLVYVGTFMESQNHLNFWRALGELAQENELFSEKLELHFYGKIDKSVSETLERHGLSRYLTRTGYIPHEKVAEAEQGAGLLLLMINEGVNAKGILTGKLFEYLASRRPILCIGPTDGDAGEIIRAADAGVISDPGDKQGIKRALTMLFDDHLAGRSRFSFQGIGRFDRRELTAQLVRCMEENLNRSEVS